MTRPVRLGKGFAIKAGKVVAKPAAKDASAAKRQRPGGSKRVRVKRGRA